MKRILTKIPVQFPLADRPYREMAETMEMTEKELIAGLEALKTSGKVRRIAAVLNNRKVSYAYNAMVVWKVDERETQRVGNIMASFNEVSHCYERDGGGYWGYNIYTMVHGKRHEDCMKIIERIANETGINDYRILFSKREFKKTSFAVHHE
jgi:DNA-binding Lrp family transcriptional regulator